LSHQPTAYPLGEFAFIERIQKRFPASEKIPLGIGDDAAAISCSAKKLTLLTTDTLIEKTHFDRAYCTFFQVGYKAVSVNLSDIAAMGGTPRFFLISLGLPPDIQISDLDALYRGIAKASREAGIHLVGGNTTATQGNFFISITLVGEVSPLKLIRRSGANEGDLLYVTGTLGDAAAGLELLKNEKDQRSFSKLVHRHKQPRARVKEGLLLAGQGIASAMIDISDGLTADLGHMMKQSQVGAELQLTQIPISPALKRYALKTEAKALDFALYGGEDYELLFSVTEKKVQKLEGLIEEGLIQAVQIGKMISKKRGLVGRNRKDGLTNIKPKGYDHFRSD